MIKNPVVSVGVDGAETPGNLLSGGLPTMRSYQLQHGQHSVQYNQFRNLNTVIGILISTLENFTTLFIKMTKGCF